MFECPFGCGYRSPSEYATQLHIDERHAEYPPAATRREASSSAVGVHGGDDHDHGSMDDDLWTRCTRPECGEYVLIYDIQEHLDLHAAVALAEKEDEPQPVSPPRRRSPTRRRFSASSSMASASKSPRKLAKSSSRLEDETRPGTRLLQYLSGAVPTQRSDTRIRATNLHVRDLPRKTAGRLGKRDLGPWAFEDSMPFHVRQRLMDGSEPRSVNRIGRDGRLLRETIVPNETCGVVPVLANLCAQDKKSATAYFCHPGVKHIYRIKCEGNFCGYWSIQALLSYVQAVNPDGPQTIPNVLKIQALIHQAWDRGICSEGRTETGGIVNTRKWIGTYEAVAFFTRIEVEIDAVGFKGDAATRELLDHVEAYFMSGADTAETHGTSYITKLPPIYLQRVGHSMTIVGIERLVDGSRNLMIFDSSFESSDPVKRLADQRQVRASPTNLLRPYRRSELSYRRWNEFEIITPRVGSASIPTAGK